MWAVMAPPEPGATEEERNSNFSEGSLTALRPTFSGGVVAPTSDFPAGELCRICVRSITGEGVKTSALRWDCRGRRVLGGSGENARNGKLQLSHNNPRTPITLNQIGAGL